MKRLAQIKLFIVILLFNCFIFLEAEAYAIFQIEVDEPNLDFGFMNIGETKELNEKGIYQNEITSSSDRANTWYLKIQALGPLQSGVDFIPYSNFEWKVTKVINGNGIIYNENHFTPFSDMPVLTYTSGPNDNSGKQIKIRFSYRLSIPKRQVSGNYRTIIRYILTENL